MTWHKLSPTILTLLIFLLAQGLGTILLFGVFMLTSPEFSSAVHAYMSGEAQSLPLLEMMPASTFSLILMVVDVLAVMGCYFLLHNIRLLKADDFSSIKWRPGILAIVGGVLGAISISILTEKVPLPDTMLQMSQEMSRNIIGLLTLVVVGPITEELLFREAIEGEMLRRGTNPWLAIIISAIAFGVAHLNFAQGLYAFPLAILFGIIYYKTGNIVLTSLLHILNNGIAAIQLNTLGEDIADLTYADWFGSQASAYIVMLLFGLLSILFMMKFWAKHPTNEQTCNKTGIMNE